ncbi:MAG: DUF4407 domain-containing protein [Gallionella sp.]|nr:DUF4407 domain-containing protein [Gallionella sp.]
MSTSPVYDPNKLDTYEYDYHHFDHVTGEARKMNLFQRTLYRFRHFLWFCAGADEQLLKLSPHSDRVKYEGIGGIVLATAVLAFFSGSYAMYTVFGEPAHLDMLPGAQAFDWFGVLKSLAAGVVWSLVIFNLDRFIITSTGHGDGTSNITGAEFLNSLPRLAMALVIGISLAAPLEIRVFKSEIESKLTEMQLDEMEKLNSKYEYRQHYEELKDNLKKKRDGIEKDMAARKESLSRSDIELNKKRQDLNDEAMGKTGHHGTGQVYQAMKEALDVLQTRADQDKAQWTIDELRLREEIASLDLQRKLADDQFKVDSARTRQQAEKLDGLGMRIHLAHELFPTAALVLMALLMVIEMTPVFIKMMLVDGPYVYLEENQQEIVKARFAIENVTHLKPDGSGKQSESLGATFHQAETIRDFEVGKLAVERSLAKTALEVFEKHVKSDIQNQPEKYLGHQQGKQVG